MLLSFCLIFSEFQPSVAYKKVLLTKRKACTQQFLMDHEALPWKLLSANHAWI